MNNNSTVSDFIKNNWDKCVRYEPEDHDTLIGMPYKYIVPTCSSAFQEMYYWDTYFACKGLVLSGRTELVKSCADNMAYMINKYGFMPNGNRTFYLDHSQPPYFCMIVKTAFDETKDLSWLREMYSAIEKEYDFWQKKRLAPIGLNFYSVDDYDEENGKSTYESITDRIKYRPPISDYESYADFANNAIAECESGWDFNPRFNFKCKSYAPADLNSNLYIYEILMAQFSELLGKGDEEIWHRRAENRKALMHKYLYNGTFFADYNFVDNTQSTVFSAAAFHPLWAGVATDEQAKTTYSQLSRIEMSCGIAACEKIDTQAVYQWAYPNSWAPLNYITVFALDRYGYKDAAVRIADKYVSSIESIFEQTGNLWEKYNAVDGSINVTNEYEMPDMLGWTAGVYLSCREYLLNNE